MKTIGLTGGIGAGKSTVSDYITEKGFKIIDADKISHDLTEKGTKTLAQIADAFGKDILNEDGSLNRKALAAIVFSDSEKLELLESMTTKRVVEIIGEKTEQYRQAGDEKIIFVDAPLMFEAGVYKLVDMVWLITADKETRIKRVMQRDGSSHEDVEKRIDSQMSDEEKKKRSQEFIDNSGGKEELYSQIEYLIKKYVG